MQIRSQRSVFAETFAERRRLPIFAGMALLTALGCSPPIQGTRGGRPWRQRLDDLIGCEVDYGGKTVLDAGCNVGILAYEITKLGPSFIHAIDGSRPRLKTSRLVSRSVATPLWSA